MLNKELLLAAGTSTVEGHIKLTVGSWSILDSVGYGFSASHSSGSLSKVPQWYDKQETSIFSIDEIASEESSGTVTLFLNPSGKEHIKTLKVTVVEKNTTVIFTSTFFYNGYIFYGDTKNLFKASDVGKTFNIIFDPPPDSYA